MLICSVERMWNTEMEGKVSDIFINLLSGRSASHRWAWHIRWCVQQWTSLFKWRWTQGVAAEQERKFSCAQTHIDICAWHNSTSECHSIVVCRQSVRESERWLKRSPSLMTRVDEDVVSVLALIYTVSHYVDVWSSSIRTSRPLSPQLLKQKTAVLWS